ncbi:MAG: hypothetical protein AVDCRST_MAG48-435, partial [uncultured Friedmanniella sp.]
ERPAERSERRLRARARAGARVPGPRAGPRQWRRDPCPPGGLRAVPRPVRRRAGGPEPGEPVLRRRQGPERPAHQGARPARGGPGRRPRAAGL